MDNTDALKAATADLIAGDKLNPTARRYHLDPRRLKVSAWHYLKRTTLERDNHQCYRCGQYGAHDSHHRQPRGMGGGHRNGYSPANIITLCRQHHDEAERNRTAAQERGHIVPAAGDPEQVPVTDHHGNTWTLHRDGTRTRNT